MQVIKTDKENAIVDTTMPLESTTLFICATNDGVDYYHQGTAEWLKMQSQKPLLPLWVQLIIIGICLCFSALFSGLNLGLMSLDRTDLKVIIFYLIFIFKFNLKFILINKNILIFFISHRFCVTQAPKMKRDTHVPFNPYAITETISYAVSSSETC